MELDHAPSVHLRKSSSSQTNRRWLLADYKGILQPGCRESTCPGVDGSVVQPGPRQRKCNPDVDDISFHLLHLYRVLFRHRSHCALAMAAPPLLLLLLPVQVCSVLAASATVARAYGGFYYLVGIILHGTGTHSCAAVVSTDVSARLAQAPRVSRSHLLVQHECAMMGLVGHL